MQNVRMMPGWRIVRALKRAGVRHADVAKTVGCSTPMVTRTIAREANTELSERIWLELERVLNGKPGAGEAPSDPNHNVA